MASPLRAWVLLLVLAATFEVRRAEATVCRRPPDRCFSCGVALARPLAGRLVSPSHVIDVVTSCNEEGLGRTPQLWTSAGPLESKWRLIEQFHVVSGTPAYQRYRRTGPPLPPGARVMLGMQGPLACQIGIYGTPCNGYRFDCAENPELDCCSIPADAPLTPLLEFDVAGEPQPSADSGAPSSPAVDAGSSDGDPAVALAEPPPFALRCTQSDTQIQLYLDIGTSPFDDAIVDVELEWLEPIAVSANSELKSYGSSWISEPCLGQRVRRFEIVWGALLPSLAPDETRALEYAIQVGGESGPLAPPIEGSLRLPEDCVSPSEIELGWQTRYFSVQCNQAESPPLADLTERYPEMLETRATGNCFLEVPDEPVASEPAPPLGEVPVVPAEGTAQVQPAPAPSPVATPLLPASSPPLGSSSPAPSSPEPKPEPLPNWGCSLGRSRSGAAPFVLLLLSWATLRRRSACDTRAA